MAWSITVIYLVSQVYYHKKVVRTLNEIEVSIVIISYNKYPLNLFTLYSFENQTFDLSKFEVIMVDDRSSDDTKRLIERYNAPFSFMYVRCGENVGRSSAKNIGIKLASGKIIVFLDAEMLVEPDFIEKHFKLHQRYDKLVISTTNAQRSVYSFLDPHFNKEQLSDLFRILKRDSSYWSNRLNLNKIRSGRIKAQALLSKEDINLGLYRKLSYSSPTFKPIIDRYGPTLNEFKMPWIFCITRNVSIPKSLIDQVGYFSQEFNGWGCEDNEYGYRLYKLGATFYDAPDIVTYHQEHPYSAESRKKESFQNIITIQTIHPEIDTAVLTLPFVNQGSYIVASHIIAEYNDLSISAPKSYQSFKRFIVESLFTIPKLCIAHMDYTILPFQQLIVQQMDKEKVQTLQSEVNSLRSFEKYQYLIHYFDSIVSNNH